ncbi:hypothetical protein ANCCEY_09001 [Ancylostoma ceylanicum]|uniref:Uncharacterized protein n=1 Tax=Ancylostoma ceylanicum TaxID=53326 RepID=A0A0D6LIP3_9BILA|nr:hypothetical protein ANCCEY_09001 [Ancylostoma ceylanicum]
MTNDNTNITINTINIAFFVFYILCFAYYQPKRKYLYGQLLACFAAVKLIFMYVDAQSGQGYMNPEILGNDIAPDVMGSIAAAMQIVSLAGGVYEIYAMFLLIVQWLAFGLLTGNQYIAPQLTRELFQIANVAALIVNLATIALYFVYPPLTWRVPIIGTGPQQKEQKKE